MRRRIGELLVERGLIGEDAVEQVLRYSARTGLRFGDAAVALGILSREALTELLGPHHSVELFALVPGNASLATRDLLPGEELARLGALPLGFKSSAGWFRSRRILNVGMIDPSREASRQAVAAAAWQRFGKEHFQGTQVFLLLADQFVDVLRLDYGVDEAALLRLADERSLDPTLARYLGREVT